MGVVEYSIAQVDQMILLERVFFAIAFSVGAGLLIGMEFARIVSHHSMDPGVWLGALSGVVASPFAVWTIRDLRRPISACLVCFCATIAVVEVFARSDPFLGLLLAWVTMLASGLLIRDSWGRVGHDDRERA